MNIQSDLIEKIHQLVDKYFEAETTADEEDLLYQYFSQDRVDASLQEYKPYFEGFSVLKENTMLLPKERLVLPKEKNFFTLHYKAISLAAASIAALIVVATLLFYHPTQSYVVMNGVKYTDPIKIETAMQSSLESVKIDAQDVLLELQDIDIE